MTETRDCLVVGTGIVELSIARESTVRQPNAKIRILEKELSACLHTSGRNSGMSYNGILIK